LLLGSGLWKLERSLLLVIRFLLNHYLLSWFFFLYNDRLFFFWLLDLLFFRISSLLSLWLLRFVNLNSFLLFVFLLLWSCLFRFRSFGIFSCRFLFNDNGLCSSSLLSSYWLLFLDLVNLLGGSFVTSLLVGFFLFLLSNWLGLLLLLLSCFLFFLLLLFLLHSLLSQYFILSLLFGLFFLFSFLEDLSLSLLFSISLSLFLLHLFLHSSLCFIRWHKVLKHVISKSVDDG